MECGWESWREVDHQFWTGFFARFEPVEGIELLLQSFLFCETFLQVSMMIDGYKDRGTTFSSRLASLAACFSVCSAVRES